MDLKESNHLLAEILYLEEGVDLYEKDHTDLRENRSDYLQKIKDIREKIDQVLRDNFDTNFRALDGLPPERLHEIRKDFLKFYRSTIEETGNNEAPDNQTEKEDTPLKKWLPLGQLIAYTETLTSLAYLEVNSAIDKYLAEALQNDLAEISIPVEHLRIQILNELKKLNQGKSKEEVNSSILEITNQVNITLDQSTIDNWQETFLQINAPLQEMYSEHVATMGVNSAMRDLQRKTKQSKFLQQVIGDRIAAWKKEDLEHDINSQSAEVNRSLIELASNAIDGNNQAGGEKNVVQITTRSDGYEIRDHGPGMNPYVILEKLMIPKVSGKTGKKTIGRFGVGFYTVLSHLKTKNDEVRVETSDGVAGHVITFKIHERAGDIFVNLERNDELERGTNIVVTAENFDQANAKKLCADLLGNHTGSEILLDSERINDLSDYQILEGEKTKVLFDPQVATEGKVCLLMNGIQIESFLIDGGNLCSHLALDFPLECSLPESRAELSIDAVAIEAIGEKLELFLKGDIPDEQKVRLCNSLAPVLEKLQSRNSSRRRDDNLLRKLENGFAENWEGSEDFLPNEPAMVELFNLPNAVFLDERVAKEENLEKIEGVDRYPGFQSNNYHVLFVVDFKPGCGEYTVELRDKRIRFISREVYERYRDNPAPINVCLRNLDNTRMNKTEVDEGRVENNIHLRERTNGDEKKNNLSTVAGENIQQNLSELSKILTWLRVAGENIQRTIPVLKEKPLKDTSVKTAMINNHIPSIKEKNIQPPSAEAIKDAKKRAVIDQEFDKVEVTDEAETIWRFLYKNHTFGCRKVAELPHITKQLFSRQTRQEQIEYAQKHSEAHFRNLDFLFFIYDHQELWEELTRLYGIIGNPRGKDTAYEIFELLLKSNLLEKAITFLSEYEDDLFIVFRNVFLGTDKVLTRFFSSKEKYEAMNRCYEIIRDYFSTKSGNELYDIGRKLVPYIFRDEDINKSPYYQYLNGEQKKISKEIRDYITYILEGGEILQEHSADHITFPEPTEPDQVTLSSLVQAKRNDQKYFQSYHGDSGRLLKETRERSKGIDLSKALRDIMHSTENQVVNDGYLWIREVLQNGLDAVIQHRDQFPEDEVPAINIETYLNDNQADPPELVVEVTDPVGMNLNTIVNFLLTPNESSKKEMAELTGKFGQGFFTIFDQAKEVRIKTSTGDGQVNYVTIKPITDLNGHILDFSVSIIQKEEEFKGTIIQKIMSCEQPAMEAAFCKSATTSYGGLLDRKQIALNFNTKEINTQREILATTDMPEYGPLTIYQAHENAITQKGLFIKEIPSYWYNHLPDNITKAVIKAGIVIDIPPNIRLIKSRADIAKEQEILPPIKQHLGELFIKSYLELVSQGKVEFENLPYDYFENTYRPQDNNQLTQDLSQLQAGNSLTSYQYYIDNPNELTHLLTRLLPLSLQGKRLSFDQLREKVKADPELPIQELPTYIQTLIRQYRKHKLQSQRVKEEYQQASGNDKQSKTIVLDDHPLPDNEKFQEESATLYAYHYLANKIFEFINAQDVSVQYYLEAGTSIAHASQKSNIIGFNLVYLEKQLPKLSEIIEQELPLSDQKVQNFLEEIILITTHERQHNLEGSGESSHNDVFFKKQRQIIKDLIMNPATNFQTTLDHIYEKFTPTHLSAKLMLSYFQGHFIA